MSTSNWTTIWKVTVEQGDWNEMRHSELLFTNERAAKAFERLCWERVDNRHLETHIEEVEVAKTADAARFNAYPFQELRAPSKSDS